MKKLFGTSALVMALALPAYAQDATTAPATGTAPADTTMTADTGMTANTGMAQSPYLEGIDRGVRASNLIGKRVYVTEQDTSTMPVDALAAADAQWDDAGEISDLIISLNGDTEAVLVDFGGFLGIGEKTVALSMSSLVMVPDSNSRDDYFIVFHGTKAEVEGAPEFNPDMVFTAAPVNDGTMMGGDLGTPATDPNLSGQVTDGQVVTDPAMAPAADGTTAATAGMAADERVDLSVMTETDLIGKRVIGPNGEDVGEISAVAIGADGAIEGAIVDVGGFLGIGEKRVSLNSDALGIVRNAGGTVDHFRVSLTQEQLEALPDYAG